MIDFSSMRNEEIVHNLCRELYIIICEHVKHFDDENIMEHIKMFMDGVSWAKGLYYAVRGGKVYIYLKCLIWAEMRLAEVEYKVIDVYFESKTLRKSINRHYHKNRILYKKGVGFDERH